MPARWSRPSRAGPTTSVDTFRPLLDHLPVPILLLDGTRIVGTNAAACDLFGLDSERLTGADLVGLAPSTQPGGEASGDTAAAMVHAARKERHVEFVWRSAQPGGRLVDSEVSLALLGSEKDALLIGVFRESTESRARDAQLRDEGRSALVGHLASGMAHSLNNLLAAIQGRLDLGRATVRSEADPRLAENLRKANECVARASVLSRRLQALAWHESAAPRLLSLNDLVEAVAERQIGGTASRAALVVLKAPDLARISADPWHVEQALLGLIDRALAAMPEGGILTLATSNQVVDEAFVRDHPWAKPGRYARLDVSDTGRPISAFERLRLFEPPSSERLRSGGPSTGLHLVYAIVKNYHGYLDFESRAGSGTTFWVLLPESPSQTLQDDLARAAAAVPSRSVLLVEDDDIVREMVSSVLRANGIEVLEARSAMRAEEIFSREGHRIDLLLTDMLPPGGNGHDLARGLRRQRPALKVIFTSGCEEPEAPASATPDADGVFVPKPFKLKDLVSKVRDLLP